MYLTRMTLNPARRGTRYLLQSPQRLHAAVMASYPPDTEARRVLWRLDRPRHHELVLYVVGACKPDMTPLVEQAGWPTTQTWDTTSYEPFLSRLRPDQTWRFRLTANPVRTLPRVDGLRSKVVPHVTAGHQEQWLRDHACGWGFAVQDGPECDGLILRRRSTDAFSRRDPEDGRRRQVTVSRAQFDGLLTVTDADRLRNALVAGMGRAKAYGCGLMSLARP